MKSVEENLTRYAAYHRDRRNIATHFAGVPMIVFALILALATATFTVASMAFTVAAVVSLAACAYYLRQDLAFGLAMAVVLLAMCAAASEITARASTAGALGIALLVFLLPAGRQAAAAPLHRGARGPDRGAPRARQRAFGRQPRDALA